MLELNTLRADISMILCRSQQFFHGYIFAGEDPTLVLESILASFGVPVEPLDCWPRIKAESYANPSELAV